MSTISSAFLSVLFSDGCDDNHSVNAHSPISPPMDLRSAVSLRSCPFVRVLSSIHLLMLTGCRKSEVLALRWQDVDLETGELRLRDAKTGARTVPLSREAAGVLAGARRLPGSPWVIPGRKPGDRLRNIDEPWRRIRTRAGLDGVRIHDLRHSFASRALALGESLPMIGKLLGHTQIRTTARYAHLARDSVNASAARVADSIGADMAAGGDAGDVGR